MVAARIAPALIAWLCLLSLLAGPCPTSAAPTHTLGPADGTWEGVMFDARHGHTAILDPVRNRIVLFGGADSSGFCLADVWTLSLSGSPAWTPYSPAGTPPAGRFGHTAIYDPVRDRMIVFGGYNATQGMRGDVWALSLAGTMAWSALAPAGTPPGARREHSAVYDSLRDRMIVFGGYDASYAYRNDVWALSLSLGGLWTALAPTGTPPTARLEHSAILDPLRDRMLVFGGYSGSGVASDVVALSLAGPTSWAPLAAGGVLPGGRASHFATYDPARDRMMVFGGTGSGSSTWPVLFLSLAGSPTWSTPIPVGVGPSGRTSAAGVYDGAADRFVTIGGMADTGGMRNGVWLLSSADPPVWTDTTPTGTLPDGRAMAAGDFDAADQRLIVFGGTTPGTWMPRLLNDVASLSLLDPPQWSALAPAGTSPSPRYAHSAIVDPVRHRLIVYGGHASASVAGDLWTLSLSGAPAWTPLVPSGTPPEGRFSHSASYDPVRDRMLVFGGIVDDGGLGSYRNEVWALTLGGTPTWALLTPGGTPPMPRADHSAIYDPVRDRLVICGGVNSSNQRYNEVWALSLAGAGTWSQLSPTGGPPAVRQAHAAIYDPVRDRMVLYGGMGLAQPQDLWALSLAGTPAWSALAPAGSPPDWRSDYVAIYQPTRDRMVVFGGSRYGNDAWALRWTTTGDVGGEVAASAGGLHSPVPNPARGPVSIGFSIARQGRVHLALYDVSGRRVRTLLDADRPAGEARVIWDGVGAAGARPAAGLYFLRLSATGIATSRRLVVLP